MRPNVFSDVLKPSPDRRDLTALQLELHSRTSRILNQYKVILNSMRVIGIFDWLLATKDFLAVSHEDPFKKGFVPFYYYLYELIVKKTLRNIIDTKYENGPLMPEWRNVIC